MFADNGRYCSIASTGPVESKSPPGAPDIAVTLVDRDGNGQLDLRAAGSFTVAVGSASRFEYRVGTGGAWAAVQSGQWLTSTANSAVYGIPQTVQFRACRDATANYCGNALSQSTATPLNARSTFTSCTAPAGSDPGSFLFRGPEASATQTVTYRASFNRPLANLLPNWEGYEPYTSGGPVPSGTTAVRLETTASVGTQTWKHVIEHPCFVPPAPTTPPEPEVPDPGPSNPSPGPTSPAPEPSNPTPGSTN